MQWLWAGLISCVGLSPVAFGVGIVDLETCLNTLHNVYMRTFYGFPFRLSWEKDLNCVIKDVTCHAAGICCIGWCNGQLVRPKVGGCWIDLDLLLLDLPSWVVSGVLLVGISLALFRRTFHVHCVFFCHGCLPFKESFSWVWNVTFNMLINAERHRIIFYAELNSPEFACMACGQVINPMGSILAPRNLQQDGVCGSCWEIYFQAIKNFVNQLKMW